MWRDPVRILPVPLSVGAADEFREVWTPGCQTALFVFVVACPSVGGIGGRRGGEVVLLDSG